MAELFKHCSKISLFCFALICPLSAWASTAFAMSLQPIIDVGLSGDKGGFIVTVLVAVVLAGLDVLLVFLKNLNKKKIVISYTGNLRSRYFKLFFHQDIARFLEKDSAAHLSKLTVDAETIGNKYCESALNLYGSLWSFIISIVCIAYARMELAVYVLFISFVSVNLPKLFQKKANLSEKNFLDSSSSHISVAQESIRNYLAIRLFDLFPSQMKKYKRIVSEVETNDIVRQKRTFLLDAASSGISAVSFILIIALCMLFVMEGKLSVGYTMSVSQLLGGIMFPLEMLPGYLVTYRTGKAIDRANKAELQENRKVDGGQKLFLTRSDDRIEIENLSFAYSADHSLVLNNVNLSLDLTKKYALLGESGSGKSTLAKLIMGLLEPTGGSISFNGKPLNQIDKSSFYDIIAYQNQNVSFFDGTMKDNILLGKPVSDHVWQRILDASCLNDMVNRLPDREFTVIQENGKNISGGEAQRICLARCLTRQPAFIIFDEIAASLDPQNALAIEKSILSLEHIGIFQITHRIYKENMRKYDLIFVLKDGRISEMGRWDELIEKRGDFYQMVIGGPAAENEMQQTKKGELPSQ